MTENSASSSMPAPRPAPDLVAWHLSGQLGGHLDVIARLEKPLLGVGGAVGRALLGILVESLAAGEWRGLSAPDEQVRADCEALLRRRVAEMVDPDVQPGGYL